MIVKIKILCINSALITRTLILIKDINDQL